MSPSNATFHHPFQPYEIQLQFMSALYDCIEEKKVAIFESPTGTGKSLSLICGSLTWLRDHKREALDAPLPDDDNDPEWMRDFAQKERHQRLLAERLDLEARLAKIREKEAKQKAAYENGAPPRKKLKAGSDGVDVATDSEEQYLLEDYESDGYENDDGTKSAFPRKQDADGLPSGLSAETLALLGKLRPQPAADATETEGDDELKIFYCSRTHSQISQFVAELRRVRLPPISGDGVSRDESERPDSPAETLKHLSLSSRRNLCINPKVASLVGATLINERCLELQQPKVAAEHRCRFLPTKENRTLVHEFRDHALAKIRDIEDLGSLGKKLGVCPYYASRAAVRPSEIVTLPYQLLLQRTARDALGISLKDHIIIIDEAHNLADAITNVHSIALSLRDLQSAASKVTIYAQRFKNRLRGKNRVYVTQLIRLISSVVEGLQKATLHAAAPDGMIPVDALMAGKGVDQINPHKLSHFLHESRLARKVDGYTANKEDAKASPASGATPVLLHVQNFLFSLMNPSDEGRMFFSTQGDEVLLRYTLLDPAHHFRDVVEDARAVILAGGTMSPMGDYADHLFPYLPPERLQTFSYGHVIPPGNLTALAVSRGPAEVELDFTFEKRHSETTIQQLGETLLAIARSTPDGLVVFLPSYDYLSKVLQIWKRPTPSGASNLYDRLNAAKSLLHESKDPIASADTTPNVLQAYTAAVTTTSPRGALLLAVVGGRLSEGINFSDRLGRGVVVVSLPFPNIHTAEWKAKIEHLETKASQRHVRDHPSSGPASRAVAKAASRDFVENACMRAVNQCIGRAIRHKDDYAAIFLIDRRYEGDRIRGKLPGWIRGSLVPGGVGAGEIPGRLDKFFTR